MKVEKKHTLTILLICATTKWFGNFFRDLHGIEKVLIQSWQPINSILTSFAIEILHFKNVFILFYGKNTVPYEIIYSFESWPRWKDKSFKVFFLAKKNTLLKLKWLLSFICLFFCCMIIWHSRYVKLFHLDLISTLF